MTQTMNPVSHTEKWGFIVLMKLPEAPPGGIFATQRQSKGYSGQGE
jgi:hypothetical protein